MKQGKQLSLFTDKEVRRSFLCRFCRNPKKEILNRFKLENLYGDKTRFTEPAFNSSCVYLGFFFSFKLHLDNKHSPVIRKEKGKYYYVD